MSKRPSNRMGKRGLWAVAFGLVLFVVGPCANVQFPPPETQLFYGVAISFG